MRIRSILVALVPVAFGALTACSAPGEELSAIQDEPTVALDADQGVQPQSNGWRRPKKWSWWYQQAVARAEATANATSQGGGQASAEAVATAFQDSIRRSGKLGEVCAQNAIAVATSVAEATCADGGKAVAKAVASVIEC